MESLAVYWNSKTEMIANQTDRGSIRHQLKQQVATVEHRPDGFKFLLEPISCEAKLKLNQKPEQDGNWSIPKVEMGVGLERLGLQVNRRQWQEFLLFLEALERFNTATNYLKYRPHLNTYKGHYKEWWRFAFTSILEEQIRRKRRNWSWERMREHRALVRDYRRAWIRKQTEKSLPHDVFALLEKAESRLDVFNLNIARQQAEFDIDRQGLTRLEDQPQGWGAWAKSWWSGGSSKPKEEHHKLDKPDDIVAQFQEAMTPEEKKKLFDAIDYEEDTPPTDYPKHFVQNRVRAQLAAVSIRVEDLLELELNTINVGFDQRPSARAISLKTTVKTLAMNGCEKPMLSLLNDHGDWLKFELETNPLDNDYDQTIGLFIAPVILRYHAPAINAAVEVFRPPETVRLNQLTAAALARFEDVKERSVTGLQHAVDHRSKLKMDVKIEPATIVISEGGVFDEQKPTLITELGLLTIQTTENAADDLYNNVESEKLRQLMLKAYDKFEIKLSNMRLLLDRDFKSCMAARDQEHSHAHILRPTGLNVALHMSSLDDVNIPKIRVIGDLPDIVIKMSDERLMELAKLAFSIPLPEADETVVDLGTEIPQTNLKDRAKMHAIMEMDEVDESAVERHIRTEGTAVGDKDGEEEADEKKSTGEDSDTESSIVRQQLVQFDVQLRLNQIGVEISYQNEPLVMANIRRLGFQFQMRTFDMIVRNQLGSITVEMPTFRSLMPQRSTLFLIDNEHAEGTENLMELIFIQANKESPFFADEYKKTEQKVECHFKTLNVTLHQEALVMMKGFFDRVNVQLQQIEAEKKKAEEKAETDGGTGGAKIKRKSSMFSLSSTNLKRTESQQSLERQKQRRERRRREEHVDESLIRMDVQAEFAALSLVIGTNKGPDTSLAITGATAVCLMKQKETRAQVTLSSVQMLDETPAAKHKHLLAVVSQNGDEMFQLDFLQHIRTDDERQKMRVDQEDMSVKIRLAQLRFVFLNLWVNRMLCWIQPFQAEAAEAAALAQQVAAEKAAETAQNVRKMLEENPQRILLDIELNAPAIVVPRRSSSNQMLLFDFGRLLVKNKFISVKQAITLDAHLPSIDLSMSKQDYANIMQTLSGNLAEGTPPRPQINTAASSGGASKGGSGDKSGGGEREEGGGVKLRSLKSATAPATLSTRSETTALAPTPGREANAGVDERKDERRIVFQFKMDEIDICLYAGDTGLEDQRGLIERRDAEKFAQMKVCQLKTTGFLSERGAMDVNISLLSFTMDDKREGQTKIPHLLDKKHSKPNEMLVSMKFKQDADGNKIIDVTSSSLFLFLSPQFLGALAAFFTVQTPEDEQQEEANRLAIRTSAGASTTAAQQSKSTAQTSDELKPPGTIALRARIQDIEVVLIENALEPESSQALILSFNCTAKVEDRDRVQEIEAGVHGLQIISTYFAESKRNLAHYTVLQPVNIVASGTIDLQTRSQDLVVGIPTVHLKVSPAVIRILSAVAANFSESNKPDSERSTKQPVLREYPDYWDAKPLKHEDYWWFTEVAQEAKEDFEPELEVVKPTDHRETAEVVIERLLITIEAGTEETTPVIQVESSLRAEASDWSGLLAVDAAMELSASYFNEAFSVWEPIIEANQQMNGEWDCWKLEAKIKTHSEEEMTESVSGRAVLPPRMSIDVFATQSLNLTITKSFLQLLNNLGNMFEQAAKQISPPSTRELPGRSPYVLQNETGVSVSVKNSDSLVVNETNTPIDATHGSFIQMDAVDRAEVRERRIGEMFDEDRRKAELIFSLMDTERCVDVHRAECRSVPLNKQADSGRQWRMLVDTQIESGRHLVVLRSHVRFVNHLDTPMEIFASADDTKLISCGVAGTDHEPLNVPLKLLYTATGEFFFQPTNETHELCAESYSWHDFDTTQRGVRWCNANGTDGGEKMYFELVLTTEDVLNEKGRKHGNFEEYTVHIYPALTFRNILPVDMHLTQPIQQTLKAGHDIPLNVVGGQSIHFKIDYEGEYTGELKCKREPEDLEILTLRNQNGREMNLGVHWGTEYLRKECTIYAPYWIVNSTGKNISYTSHSEQEIRHEADRNPVLMPFPDKTFRPKKKARVRVEGSALSDEFPIDTAGNAGRVTCKTADGFEYELSVDVQLCQSGLTKVVTFTAFYLLQNSSKFDIQVKEYNSKEWLDVRAESCVSLWPAQNTKRKFIVLPTNDKHLGFYVTCTVAESSSVVNIEGFTPGMASAILINDTERPIHYVQKGLPEEAGYTLAPQQQRIFTYSDVTSKVRAIEWRTGTYKGEISLVMDNLQSFEPERTSAYNYWASFLNGRQRTILFTADLSVATTAKEAYEVERMDKQVELSLNGINLSLVNNRVGQEILCLGIDSTDVVWEQKQRSRYRPLPHSQWETIEYEHQQWLAGGKKAGWTKFEDYEVDFEHMLLKKSGKQKSEVSIRRSFQHGLYVMCRQSAHQTQLHFKLNHIQIDNQLPACVFPCVLAVVPPPKSVVADNAPRPFAEMTFIMMQSEHSNVVQIKYLKLLVQEFDIRIDKGLMFNKDLELARPKLHERVTATKASQQKAFYHDLHISPLMIHFSFSQGGSSKKRTPAAVDGAHHVDRPSNRVFSLVHVLMKSVGVTVTEVQDVVFKLAYFERKHTFYNKEQLQSEMTSHYTKQFIKQLYVLVLGLDVIGNPYGLVTDVASGVVDAFYQPFQGIIQGPEEFVEGMALGVTSLFSHTFGGAAMAVSRITGTVGKGVAALTLDEEYQRKRQEALNRRPENFAEGISRSADAVRQGVVGGVTGVFTKPIEGARQGGAGGFVKGLGKGLVGVVLRPASGVVDFASGTINSVRSVATGSKTVEPIRPTRFIPLDHIVRPFNHAEACGYKIFRDTDNGYYADTDNFIGHAFIDERNVFIITDRRVLLSTRKTITGSWGTDWEFEYDQLMPPQPTESGVKLAFKERKKSLLGFSKSVGKGIKFANAQEAHVVNAKLQAAYEQAM
ncbi:Vacuolar protein sorting-associated protein 13C [Aphelenchoides fujianensis]|nr:Vacuolar protein sorting-associated protein 13C [Aphelenchoides fujianensis]